MKDRRLDRQDHPFLQRQVRIIGGVWHWPGIGEPRRFVTDEPHAVSHEFERIAVRRRARQFLYRGIYVAAPRPMPDRSSRRLLDRLDLAEQLFELGVGLAENGHSAKVTDIAIEVAAGV